MYAVELTLGCVHDAAFPETADLNRARQVAVAMTHATICLVTLGKLEDYFSLRIVTQHFDALQFANMSHAQLSSATCLEISTITKKNK